MATTTAFGQGEGGGQMPAERQTNLSDVNVGEMERWISMVAGGILAGYGLSRRSLAGLGLAAIGGSLLYRGGTGHCSLYSALGINTACSHGSQASIPAGHGVKVEESITVDRPPHEVYQFWRKLENLPRVMQHLESVEPVGDNRWRWVARGPLGTRFSWDAEIITEATNELIGWRSLHGSQVDTAGSIHFRPTADGRGTEVRVSLKYYAPAGRVGDALAQMLGHSPGQQIREDLQRFKQIMEGEGARQTAGT
jgi:uncharacterized membrane protein